jgi:hypothetical protein
MAKVPVLAGQDWLATTSTPSEAGGDKWRKLTTKGLVA